MDIGRRIYEQRTAKGLTMEQLANMLGVQKSAVNKWEKGITKNIKRPTILKLSEIFGCEPAHLMGFDELVDDYSKKKGIKKVPIIATVETEVYSKEEKAIIEAYRKLDTDGKETIKRVLAYAKKMEGR